MVRKCWGGVALLVSVAAGAGVAGAADLAVKAPVYKAAPAYMSDWSGFYIGVHGGYGWGYSSIDTPDFPYLQSDDPKKGDVVQLGSFDASPKGGVVGGHAGYNWQYGHVVTGLEIDFSAADIKTSGTVGTFSLECLPGPGTIFRSLKFDELATARARLGYLVLPDLLAYGTAGLGWGHSELYGSASVGQPSWLPPPGSGFANNFGWVAGGGLEHKLWEHVLVRVEYLHYDFGKTTYVTPAFTTNASTTIDVVRAGLSYKF
jgi:outer membrane immunogenic protein